MNCKRENDFVAKVKTPTTCLSPCGSPNADQDRSITNKFKTSSVNKSADSVTYSDSFDNDSPVKPITLKRVNKKTKCFKSTTFYRKSKVSVYGVLRVAKPNETTQKLLESNRIKINELLSEKADCQRQLKEKIDELKTLQNQNKIQEKYLQKVNSRDADVPNIISRYNSEIHSIQEQLRRNKEKLNTTGKQRRELEVELNKAKAKNERLNSLCENKELHEKDDLIKKVRMLTDQLDVEARKQTDSERSIELITKKHNHRLNKEVNKYKELNQTYKEVIIELREVKNLLKHCLVPGWIKIIEPNINLNPEENVFTAEKYKGKEVDVFCSSESDDLSSDERSGHTSSCLFQPRSDVRLKDSRKYIDSRKDGTLFVGLSRNNNTNNGDDSDNRDGSSLGHDDDKESVQEFEEINIT